MSELYVQSSEIIVFPSTRRFDKQFSARTLSESSFVGLINELIDTEGFVITPDEEDTEIIDFEKPFEFNIHGYYFRVESANTILDLFSSPDEIYANITLDNTGKYVELQGQDETDLNDLSISYYEGVKFTTEPLTTANTYSLLLFVKENDKYYVPIESRIKFNTGIALGVDGGEI